LAEWLGIGDPLPLIAFKLANATEPSGRRWVPRASTWRLGCHEVDSWKPKNSFPTPGRPGIAARGGKRASGLARVSAGLMPR
jgi:hypothetical protein